MPDYSSTPSGFSRLYAGPIDADSVFDDRDAMMSYIRNEGTAYPGQVCWCEEEGLLYAIVAPSEERVTRIAQGGVGTQGKYMTLGSSDVSEVLSQFYQASTNNNYGAITTPGDHTSELQTAENSGDTSSAYVGYHDGMRLDDSNYDKDNNNADKFIGRVTDYEYDADNDKTKVWFDPASSRDHSYFYDSNTDDYVSFHYIDGQGRTATYEIQDYNNVTWLKEKKVKRTYGIVLNGDKTDIIGTPFSWNFSSASIKKTENSFKSISLNEDGNTEILFQGNGQDIPFDSLVQNPNSLSFEFMTGEEIEPSRAYGLGPNGTKSLADDGTAIGFGALAQDKEETVIGAMNRRRSFTNQKKRLFTIGVGTSKDSFNATPQDGAYVDRGDPTLYLKNFDIDAQEPPSEQYWNGYDQLEGEVPVKISNRFGRGYWTKVPFQDMTPPVVDKDGNEVSNEGGVLYHNKNYNDRPSYIASNEIGIDGNRGSLYVGTSIRGGGKDSLVVGPFSGKYLGNRNLFVGSSAYSFSNGFRDSFVSGSGHIISADNNNFIAGRDHKLGEIDFSNPIVFKGLKRANDGQIVINKTKYESLSNDEKGLDYIEIWKYGSPTTGSDITDADYKSIIVETSVDYSEDEITLTLRDSVPYWITQTDNAFWDWGNNEPGVRFGRFDGGGGEQTIVGGENNKISGGTKNTIIGGRQNNISEGSDNVIVGGERGKFSTMENHEFDGPQESTVLGGFKGAVSGNALRATSVGGGVTRANRSVGVGASHRAGGFFLPFDEEVYSNSIEDSKYTVGSQTTINGNTGYPLDYVEIALDGEPRNRWTKKGDDTAPIDHIPVLIRTNKQKSGRNSVYRDNDAIYAESYRTEFIKEEFGEGIIIRLHWTKESDGSYITNIDNQTPLFSVNPKNTGRTVSVRHPVRGGRESVALAAGRTIGGVNDDDSEEIDMVAANAGLAGANQAFAANRSHVLGQNSFGANDGKVHANDSFAIGTGVAHDRGQFAFSGIRSRGFQVAKNTFSKEVPSGETHQLFEDGDSFTGTRNQRNVRGVFFPKNTLTLVKATFFLDLFDDGFDNYRIEEHKLVVLRDEYKKPNILSHPSPTVIDSSGSDISNVTYTISTGVFGELMVEVTNNTSKETAIRMNVEVMEAVENRVDSYHRVPDQEKMDFIDYVQSNGNSVF